MSDILAVLITPEANAEIDRTRASHNALERARDWPCETAEEQSEVTTMLSMVQARLAAIEATRTSITKPLLDAKRRVDELFRGLSEPYELTKESLKSKLAAAAMRHRAALAAATEAAIAGDDPVFAPVVAAPPALAWEWSYSVDDLGKVPRDYLTLDSAAVRAFMSTYRKSDVIPQVPGLSFTRVPKVVARR